MNGAGEKWSPHDLSMTCEPSRVRCCLRLLFETRAFDVMPSPAVCSPGGRQQLSCRQGCTTRISDQRSRGLQIPPVDWARARKKNTERAEFHGIRAKVRTPHMHRPSDHPLHNLLQCPSLKIRLSSTSRILLKFPQQLLSCAWLQVLGNGPQRLHVVENNGLTDVAAPPNRFLHLVRDLLKQRPQLQRRAICKDIENVTKRRRKRNGPWTTTFGVGCSRHTETVIKCYSFK